MRIDKKELWWEDALDTVRVYQNEPTDYTPRPHHAVIGLVLTEENGRKHVLRCVEIEKTTLEAFQTSATVDHIVLTQVAWDRWVLELGGTLHEDTQY